MCSFLLYRWWYVRDSFPVTNELLVSCFRQKCLLNALNVCKCEHLFIKNGTTEQTRVIFLLFAVIGSRSILNMSGSNFIQSAEVMEQEGAVKWKATGDRLHTSNFSVRLTTNPPPSSCQSALHAFFNYRGNVTPATLLLALLLLHGADTWGIF